MPENGASPAFYESLLGLTHDLARAPSASLAMEKNSRLLMLHRRLTLGGGDYGGFAGFLDAFLELCAALFVHLPARLIADSRGESGAAVQVPESVIRAQ